MKVELIIIGALVTFIGVILLDRIEINRKEDLKVISSITLIFFGSLLIGITMGFNLVYDGIVPVKSNRVKADYEIIVKTRNGIEERDTLLYLVPKYQK